MARPDWRSLGRNAQRSTDAIPGIRPSGPPSAVQIRSRRICVNYACAFLGRDKSAGSGLEQPLGWPEGRRAGRPELRQPCRTLEPPRDERW